MSYPAALISAAVFVFSMEMWARKHRLQSLETLAQQAAQVDSLLVPPG